MKKFITLFLIIISLSACKNDNKLNSASKEGENIQNNSVETEEVHGIPAESQNTDLKTSHEFCYIDKAKSEKDPELEELYKKLSQLQTSADEMSKYPKTSDILKDITKDIGNIKGLIEYRSLEINAKI